MPGTSPELRRGRGLSTKRSGDRGETLALRHLAGKGYELIEKNYRTRHGEIDLIMRDGGALVFVEVKLRRGTGFGGPLEAVTPRKQASIRSLAEQYLVASVAGFEEVRFDVVGILERGRRREITHVPDAF